MDMLETTEWTRSGPNTTSLQSVTDPNDDRSAWRRVLCGSEQEMLAHMQQYVGEHDEQCDQHGPCDESQPREHNERTKASSRVMRRASCCAGTR
jgi:hypothetical protein